MLDDGISFNDPTRLDIEFDFKMTDKTKGILIFNAKSTGFSQSEAAKLKIIKFLGADYTYIFECVNAKVNGGTAIKGTFNSTHKILEFNFNGFDMNNINTIEFSK